MSSKAAWVSAIGTVAAAVIAGAALWSNNGQPTESTALVNQKRQKELPVAKSGNSTLTKSESKSRKEKLCKDKYGPLIEIIGSSSLSYKQDEGFLTTSDNAIKEGCFEEAHIAIKKLSLFYKQDEQHEKLYKEAIKRKEFSSAKSAIDNLSLGYKRDKGYEALSAAIANSATLISN